MSDKITVYDIQLTAPPKVVVDQPDITADRADVEEGWVYDTWAEAAARIAHCMRTHPGGLVLVGQHQMTREEYASLGPDPDPLPPSVGGDLMEDFQYSVAEWARQCFGLETALDPLERADRFCEEALELLQAANYDPLRVRALLDYVYNRPAGVLGQEVGGVLVTLAAFCQAHSERMQERGNWELARVWANVEKIRAKHAAKPRGSALPGAVPVPVPHDSDARQLLLQMVVAARGTDDERLVAATEKAEMLLGLDVVQEAEQEAAALGHAHRPV